jgi:hypothetical protein
MARLLLPSGDWGVPMKRACGRIAAISICLATAACTQSDAHPGGQEAAAVPREALRSGGILVGKLAYGETSQPVTTSGPIRFRAFRFDGVAGDEVTIDVRSTNGGDAQTWLVSGDLEILAFNDDGGGDSPDSHIEHTLADSGTHFILFRDARHRRKTFTVELQGGPPGAAALAIGMSWSLARLVTFDPVAGSIVETHLQMGPQHFIGMTYDPVHDLLYTVPQGHHDLYAIDPATMAVSHFGNLRVDRRASGIVDVQALAYDPIAERLFATLVRAEDVSDTATWRTELVVIDIATATPTTVGTIPLVFVSSMDFNGEDGQLYGLAKGGDGLLRILRIDPDDASSEEVLVTPYTTMLGLARTPGTNKYLTWINADSHFYGEIDLDSGIITQLGNSDPVDAIAAFVHRGFDAVSVPVPRPEVPASFQLTGHVVAVDDPEGFLAGAIAAGDGLTGRIVYDVNAPYRAFETVPEGAYQLSATVEGLHFAIDTHVASVLNNFYSDSDGTVIDGIFLSADRLGASGFPVPMNFEQIRWTLTDSTAQAVSNNDVLPLAFDLSAWDGNELVLFAASNDFSDDGYEITAVVDTIVPE